jgi:hypothetical protein
VMAIDVHLEVAELIHGSREEEEEILEAVGRAASAQRSVKSLKLRRFACLLGCVGVRSSRHAVTGSQ